MVPQGTIHNLATISLVSQCARCADGADDGADDSALPELADARSLAVAGRALPRANGGDGLYAYLAPRGTPWPPPEPLAYDLARDFVQAWRLPPAPETLQLPAAWAGQVVGVHNVGRDGFHGAVRAYTLRSAATKGVGAATSK